MSAPGVVVSALGCVCLLQGVSALGGVCSWGDVSSQGVSAPEGVSAPGDRVSAPGGGCGIPACTEADTPPWTESQTPVKTLPWPNFVAAGNNTFPQLRWQAVITCFAQICLQFA